MGKAKLYAAAALFCALALRGAGVPAAAQDGSGVVRDALTIQKARTGNMQARSFKEYYKPGRFDVTDLPAYRPAVKVSGPIRIWASDLLGNPGFQKKLETAFRKFHPDASFTYVAGSPAETFAGILLGEADVSIARRMMWVDILSFQRKFDSDPVVIRGMTGWSVNPPFVIAVHKDNPIRKLSLAQVDGIFGAERNGGWKGTSWDPGLARGPDKNVRSWGQAGAGGAWKNRAIDVYGYNLMYLFAPRFSEDIMGNSHKWNERLVQFSIYADASGKSVSVDQQMADAVAANPAAIAYYAPLRGVHADTRHVPIEMPGGELVSADLDAVREHRYPFTDSMWFYAKRDPQGQIDPKVKEFLSFILSREAQEEVGLDTTMLPLTAALAAAERKKLD